MGRLGTGIAFVFGAGLGIGVGAVAASGNGSPRRREQATPSPRPAAPAADEPAILKLEPLLDRLERVEAYVDAARSVEPGLPVQADDRHAIENSLHAAEHDAALTLDVIHETFEDLRRELPSMVEAAVKARIASLTSSLAGVTENFVDLKIAERVAPLEQALLEQQASISSLRARSEDTDVNLQRLIVSIDRLCELNPVAPRSQAAAAPSAPPLPDFARAMPPKEAEQPEPRRPRVPMARIFGAFLAVGIARFFHS